MAAKKDDALTRVDAGNWRTKDGRFLIRGESGGHWYLIDDLRRDPFGLELVSGPYATVAAARHAIALARADFPDGSAAPESPELPEAAESPSRPEADEPPAAPKRGGAAAAPRRSVPARTPRKAPEQATVPAARVGVRDRAPDTSAATPAAPVDPPAQASAPPETPATAEPAPPAATAEPGEPAWIEALPSAGRRAARRSIKALDRLGIEDAGDIVRRDLTTDAPEVARAILLQRVAAIIAEAADPASARPIVAEVLRLLTVAGRAAEGGPALPGWHLAEDRTGGPGRPIVLEADDLDTTLDAALHQTPRQRTHPKR